MAKTATKEKKSEKSTEDEKEASQSKQNGTTAHDSQKKKHKEQAKREAKLMLKLEQAKKELQKAEQKLTKAQKSHEEAVSRRNQFEERLQELRQTEATESHNGVVANSTSVVPQAAETPLSLETPFITQSVDTASIDADTGDATPESDIQTNTGAEAHNDIHDAAQAHELQSANNEQSESSPTSHSADIQVGSDGVSMPLLTSDESAWPPPVIREEVAEAAQADATPHEEETDTSGE